MNTTVMPEDRQHQVESIVLQMMDALENIMEISPISAAFAFQQISTRYLCQFDRASVAEILQAGAEHARKEVSAEEFHRRSHAPYDLICAAFDRADQPLN